MKKIKYLILLILLFPIVVYAKTPNKEETLKVIEKIENVHVSESMTINNISIGDNKFTLIIDNDGKYLEKEINYKFMDNELVFSSDIDENNLDDSNYAFYLYSILENKSSAPYDILNYYNNNNISEKISKQSESTKNYIDNSKTFGLTINKNKKIKVLYHYYFTGDYPVMEKEILQSDTFTNPSTRNYTIIVTIMLIVVIGIGIYTYLDIPNKRIKGEN